MVFLPFKFKKFLTESKRYHGLCTTETPPDRQTDRQTEKQKNRQTDRQTERQTDKQTDR